MASFSRKGRTLWVIFHLPSLLEGTEFLVLWYTLEKRFVWPCLGRRLERNLAPEAPLCLVSRSGMVPWEHHFVSPDTPFCCGRCQNIGIQESETRILKLLSKNLQLYTPSSLCSDSA